MATWYVDNVGGSSSNGGTSTSDAKAHPEELIGLMSVGDIVRQKATGVDYSWTIVSTATVWSPGVFFTRYVGDTSYPKNVFTKGAGIWSLGSAQMTIKDIDFKLDWGSLTTNTCLQFMNNTATAGTNKSTMMGGTIEYVRTSAAATLVSNVFYQNTSNPRVIFKGVNHIFDKKRYSISLSNANLGTVTDCVFYDNMIGTTTMLQGASLISRNIFDCTEQAANSYILQGSTTAQMLIYNNTFIMRGTTLANFAVFGATANTIDFSIYDNIVINLKTGGSTAMVYGTSAITFLDNVPFLTGNNAYYVTSGSTHNIYSNVTGGREDFGTSPVMSSNPLLSTTYGDANYCQINTSNTDAINYLLTKAVGYKNGDVGALQALSSVTPPSASDIKIGVVVQGVTGTYDGSDRWSHLSPSDIRSGVSYKDNSLTNNKTGTLDLPATSNVKTGITYDGATKTGTYDGSDRWSDPGVANVRTGTAYKANSVTNNRTGSLDLPAQADVKTGVSYDGATKTGTYDGSDRWSNPGTTNVRSGTAYKANSLTNNQTGTLDLPATSDVKIGVTFDGASKTGTYTGADRFTVPAENEVKIGVNFKDNNVNKTGTYDGSDRFTVPSESDVREGVDFIDNTVPKTGDLHLPVTSDILANELKVGLTKTIKDVSVTGTYDGADRFTVPSESDVRDGVSFVDNTVPKTGTLTIDEPPADAVLVGFTTGGEQGTVSLPDESDVRLGVHYGPQDQLEGTAEVGSLSIDPGEGNVLLGVEYEINGVPKVGQYDTGEGDITPNENNIRVKVLKKIEDVLYGIDPAKSARYQNVVRSVSYEPLTQQGILQDDMPHVQVNAEDNEYDHQFILSGNMPMVTMKVRLVITSPANWTALDCESLYEDIRQGFIRDNYTLDGLVISTQVLNFSPLAADSDKEDQNRKAQLSLVFKFIEVIEQ